MTVKVHGVSTPGNLGVRNCVEEQEDESVAVFTAGENVHSSN